MALMERERRREEHSRRAFIKGEGAGKYNQIIGGSRKAFYDVKTHILDLANGKRLDVQVHRAPKDSTLGDWVWIGDTNLHIVIGKPDQETHPDKKYSVYVTANRNIE